MMKQIEVKILVAENKQHELEEIILKLKELGLKIDRQGGGNMPSFSGYYATLSK